MKLDHLTKTYDGRCVLSVDSLELERGLVYAVVGSNGSGKSTLARILAGQLAPDDPSALQGFDDILVTYAPQRPYRFQMKVLRNILLASKDKEADLLQARKLMDCLEIEELADKNARDLSGGEAARVAIARAMMLSSDLLILDEPTAALDMHSTIKAEELIRDYRDEHGSTVLLITHSLPQARRISDMTLFFHKGVLWEAGPTENVLASPEHPETQEFIDFSGK